MCTGEAYRPLRHDRHLSEASSFQIGVSRGRLIASNGILALVPHRWHFTSRHCAMVGGRLGRAAEAFHAKRPQLGLVPVDIALRLLDGLPRPLSAFPRP
jgi:hypothetical protein